MHKNRSNLLFRTAGILLMVVSAVFITQLFCSQRKLLLSWRPDIGTVLVLFLGIPFYAALNFLLAHSWRRLLLWSGEKDVNAIHAVIIFARSQIAKYIPGNMVHLASRHVMGRHVGWSHSGLVISTTLELLFLLWFASTISIVRIVLSNTTHDPLSLSLLFTVLGILTVGIPLMIHLSSTTNMSCWPNVAIPLRQNKLSALWPIGLMYLCFLVCGGMILLGVVLTVHSPIVPPALWPNVISLFSMAWVAGTITPGSPSGIGIRESVLVLGFKNIAPTGEALLIAGILRFITVFGDILFLIAAGGRYSGLKDWQKS